MTGFVNLGHKLSCWNNQKVEVKHWINLGWVTFGKHKGMSKSTRVSIHAKTNIYLIYILSAVLQVSACVTCTERLSPQIETFQNHMVCIITDHKLKEAVKITILKNVINLLYSSILSVANPWNYLDTIWCRVCQIVSLVHGAWK